MKPISNRSIRIASILSIFILVMIHLPMLVFSSEVTSTGSSTVLSGNNKMVMSIAAMGAIAFSCITSAYALAKIGSAALGAMSEKPEIGARAVIFLGLAEGIAIYGLIVAMMILNKI